ncbi:lectin-domain containing receptor kinase VI.3-like [Humulus lupulus]|uniref:lectin-domain containing receptor kinase VI.3-like n=1 Tax=Humulus lupulus TaxID=3486 RepID=UPI002B417518|nr:lectin-domain containing receptor kinase VI.3-like [Humulus lupulus]
MAAPTSSLAFLIISSSLIIISAQLQDLKFVFHGFKGNETNLTTEGASIIKNTGLLRLTNRSQNVTGHAFYSERIRMTERTSPSHPKNVSSFSTHFVFAIVHRGSDPGGYGLTFTISPKNRFPEAEADHYLGLFNKANDGSSTNHIFAVEFDTVNGFNENADRNGNHVGININGMLSNAAEPAAYYREGSDSNKEDVDLESGDPIQAWIDYDGQTSFVNVTIAPTSLDQRPSRPLLSKWVNLTDVVLDDMYIGFSSSTGIKASSHYILGWSFALNGEAPPLNLTQLPTSSAGSFNAGRIMLFLSSVIVTLLLLGI